jgi:hypothetical protein
MTTATTEPTRRDRRLRRDGLAASRRVAACGREGLATAFRRASEEGFIDDHDHLDDYLEAVLEGEVEDVLGEAGWRACMRPRRCRRAGRCLRPRP